ncbi:hypothetical protein HHK36_015598 [Tetracentron sinense]|uniref:AIR9-like A9 domain-containing protein n=1 Tax=Tetracentron sinense TaxID=13715 RepID=A0A834ZC05_TETSI|nr:hypothetical protein HHK36_015598 [Tetracentron sinense]
MENIHSGCQSSHHTVPVPDDPTPLVSSSLLSTTGVTSSPLTQTAEGDPCPAVEALQISGEAFPGREIQACGYSINGTTNCYFAWLRCSEDGSVYRIEGADQATYLVTADDVDSYLAIEVQPMDDRKRKGKVVKVFANEKKKITWVCSNFSNFLIAAEELPVH